MLIRLLPKCVETALFRRQEDLGWEEPDLACGLKAEFAPPGEFALLSSRPSIKQFT
jgi:hypothetical protein